MSDPQSASPATTDGPETEFGLEYRASLHRDHPWLRAELDRLPALAVQVGAGEVGVREARATIDALAVAGHRRDLGAGVVVAAQTA
ncbi:hypothetical protein WHI96_19700 [Pseudonocardia tropica]|uniref:Uncharacterized protein n=1 Tax=Pseudonocardia tropica TaxID=681289 RepID=A0ABV1JYL5_9PSEU